MDGSSELVFRSPTFKETFGNTIFVILIIAFGFPFVLICSLAILAGYKSVALVLLVLPGLALFSIVLYLLLRTGRVVLKSDELIEYNLLNHPRVVKYTQVFEVKRGVHPDQVWIRYYSMNRNGQINYASVRGRNLISVQKESELRGELSQRISAPAPGLLQSMNSTLILLLLAFLGIPVVAMVFYLLAVAVSKH